MQDNDLRQAYLNAGDAAAEEMRDGRVVKGSKNTFMDQKLLWLRTGWEILHQIRSKKISSNYVSYDSFSGYRSALKHEYQNQRVQWDGETQQVFKEILAGYNRDVANMKQEGTMDINEGKMPITFTVSFI